jgi:23S rRNA pseudouridine2605 synthase
MRLQKLLAAAGFGSRRACEDLIRAGRVTVNGAVPEMGYSSKPEDQIRVNGKLLNVPEKLVYIALHKPIGFISDLGSAEYNKSALDLVKVPQRLFPVGRLDKDSSGLLLLTNDGDLAYHLTHPKFEHEKEYWAWVDGAPSEHALRLWRTGVKLIGESEKTARCQVTVLSVVPAPLPHSEGRTWLRIVLHEGRKRQIRRVGKQLGYPVVQLVRMRIGSLTLGALKSGQWRELTQTEVKKLTGQAHESR